MQDDQVLSGATYHERERAVNAEIALRSLAVNVSTIAAEMRVDRTWSSLVQAWAERLEFIAATARQAGGLGSSYDAEVDPKVKR